MQYSHTEGAKAPVNQARGLLTFRRPLFSTLCTALATLSLLGPLVAEAQTANRRAAPTRTEVRNTATAPAPVAAAPAPAAPQAPAPAPTDPATAAAGNEPLSLKDVAVPEPTNLYAFLKGTAGRTDGNAARTAAIRLGKALFWDMQIGSDNVQACATCHFNAGVDSRAKNQLDPGTNDGDEIFGNTKIPGVPGPNEAPWYYWFAPNFRLQAEHFPTHRRADPHAKADGFGNANVIMDTNDIVSSQGVRLGDCAVNCGDARDLVFNYAGDNVRRSAPRNAPSAVNAAFHVDQFWDGRASFIFNGMTPFGFRDQASVVKRVVNGQVRDVKVRIPYASFASQGVGPPLSLREMTGHQRDFDDLANKLLAPTAIPLALQRVSPSDSVLGPLARSSNRPGLSRHYQQLIFEAFRSEWTGTQTNTVGAPSAVMRHNFPLFFGLALLLYQNTLIADDTPFDRYMGARRAVRQGNAAIAPDPSALTPQEQLGLALYVGPGKCDACHALPETSNHVVRAAGLQSRPPRNDPVLGWVNRPQDPINEVYPSSLIELMTMGDGRLGVYDSGFYNIGVRPTTEDIARAATAPSGLPLSYTELALLKRSAALPPDVAPFVPETGKDEAGNLLPASMIFLQALNRTVTRGAFKTPMLRNQLYQGPYFHNGEDATLRHVVEFYSRGGNFPQTNHDDLDADITYLPEFDAGKGEAEEQNIQALVAFLARGLTDPRVVFERAPFDHPEIFIPSGINAQTHRPEVFITLPMVGREGRTTPINRFLDLDPQSR